MKARFVIALLILPILAFASDGSWFQVSDSEFIRLAWDDVVLVGFDNTTTPPSATLWSIAPSSELKAVAKVTGSTAIENVRTRLRGEPHRWFGVQTSAFPGGSPWDDFEKYPAFVSLPHAYRVHVLHSIDAPGSDKTVAQVVLRAPNATGLMAARTVDQAERERLLTAIRQK